jgi:hypothetical protein
VLGYELLLDWLELDTDAVPGENVMTVDTAPDEEMDGG